MEKLIAIALNKFPRVPHSLREIPSVDAAAKEIRVPLAQLYHHYFLDNHGQRPPNPDPAHFEHLQFLSSCDDFRARGDGIAFSPHARRNRSNEFGHAFCRWFLHDHLKITYFAHMADVLKRTLPKGFGGLSVNRVSKGDTPDYFCARDVNRVFLAEAKGRHGAISFARAEFSKWREQFSRVEVRTASGVALSVKGFIVATRFASEAEPFVNSTIYSEDPNSPGEDPLGEEQSSALGGTIISMHYASIAEKLGMQLLASALLNGFKLPDQIQQPATIWEFLAGPLEKKRFVGGYFLKNEQPLQWRRRGNQVIPDGVDPLRLDSPQGTFFGLEERVFSQVVSRARAIDAIEPISTFEEITPFYSGVSVLRDGSMIAPLEFLRPVEQRFF